MAWPEKIISRINNGNAYKVSKGEKEEIVNIKNIKPYRTLQKWNEKPIELDLEEIRYEKEEQNKKGGEKVTEPEQMGIEPIARANN